MIEHLLTPHETAEYLGVRVNTIRTWARRGQIPVQRVGRCLRFSPTELTDWLATQARPPQDDVFWGEPTAPAPSPPPGADVCKRCGRLLLDRARTRNACGNARSCRRFPRRRPQTTPEVAKVSQ
jgi:excisionase family DNA binding protein